MRGTALVRRPSPRLAEGLVTHIERTSVDVGLAEGQWEDYVQALRGAGWDTVEVAPADDCPDAVFVEDTMVAYEDVAVISRPGAGARRPETAAVESVVESLGLEVHRIEEPGTLDGGDVLTVGDTVYVGTGGRTSPEGARQLRDILASRGARVVDVPVRRVLHLKSSVTALPDGSVIGYPPLTDAPSAFPSFRPVPEESGSHVVLLGEAQLLMAADAPRSAALFASLGYEPVVIDISEFQKMEGCVTCLSVRLHGASRSSPDVPPRTGR